MSRSAKATKAAGKEYWTSRGGKRHGEIPGAFTKRKTHRFERRLGKVCLKEEV